MDDVKKASTQDGLPALTTTVVSADSEKQGLSPPPVGGDTHRGLSNRMVQMISLGGWYICLPAHFEPTCPHPDSLPCSIGCAASPVPELAVLSAPI